jgi:hypothetical protein
MAVKILHGELYAGDSAHLLQTGFDDLGINHSFLHAARQSVNTCSICVFSKGIRTQNTQTNPEKKQSSAGLPPALLYFYSISS